MGKTIKYRLKIEHLWGLVALAGIFIFINTHPVRPHDFWWHITIGREIIETGHIPVSDIYSFTEYGQAYPSYQMYWLMDSFLFLLYKIGGLALVVFIFSLMITMAYSVIFLICKQVSNNWRVAAGGVIFAAALGLNDWNVRPQGVTFLLGSLFILAIYEYQKARQWGWLLIFPLGMLIWVNSHGTFIIGFILVGIWIGQEFWNLILSKLGRETELHPNLLLAPCLVLASVIIASFINPRGFGILTYLKTLTGNSVVRRMVIEWAPPNINTSMGIIFFVGLALSVSVFLLSPKRPSFSQITTLLVFGYLGLKTSRGIVWFGMVMAPILAEHLSYVIQRFRKQESRQVNPEGSLVLNGLFSVVILAMVVITLPWFKESLPFPQAKAGLISSETPVKATAALLSLQPPKQVFNSISFGSYMIWKAYPDYQVFVDSRIELYPEKVWLDYLSISNANDNWETLLKAYKVNSLFLSPAEQPKLIKEAKESGEWLEVYNDPTAIIFRRK